MNRFWEGIMGELSSPFDGAFGFAEFFVCFFLIGTAALLLPGSSQDIYHDNKEVAACTATHSGRICAYYGHDWNICAFMPYYCYLFTSSHLLQVRELCHARIRANSFLDTKSCHFKGHFYLYVSFGLHCASLVSQIRTQDGPCPPSF